MDKITKKLNQIKNQKITQNIQELIKHDNVLDLTYEILKMSSFMKLKGIWEDYVDKRKEEYAKENKT